MALKAGSSLLIAQLAMAVFGAGLGFAATSLLIAVQTSVGWELRGVATGSNMFFRTIGGTVGIGTMGGVLVSRLTRDPAVPIEAANSLLGPEHGRSLAPEVLRVLGSGLESGLSTNFWIMFAFASAAFLCALFFPRGRKAIADPNTELTPAGEGAL